MTDQAARNEEALVPAGLTPAAAALFQEPHAIEGAIFDCDGTLLDSLGAWRAMEDAIAQESGGACVVSDQDRAVMIACTVPETARYLHEEMGFAASCEDAEAFMDRFLIEHYANDATLYPGARALLEALAAQEIPLAVASSSKPAYLKAGLEGTGIAGFFQEVVSVDDLGLSKRDPRFYQGVARLLGTQPERTWVFEDALYAVRTSVAAGFPTVGLSEGESSGEPQTFDREATLAVGHLADLVAG